MANQRREEIASTTADPVIDAKPEVPAKPAKKVDISSHHHGDPCAEEFRVRSLKGNWSLAAKIWKSVKSACPSAALCLSEGPSY